MFLGWRFSLVALLLALSFGYTHPTPRVAARQHAIDPKLLDPKLLALKPSDLPPGLVEVASETDRDTFSDPHVSNAAQQDVYALPPKRTPTCRTPSRIR